MKHLKFLFLAVIALLALNSCNSEDDTNSPTTKIKSESVSFTYKGVSYYSIYKLSSDSIVIWDNPEVGKLYEELDQLPELSTLINNDNSIIYFDNETELKEYISIIDTNKVQTRGVWDPTSIDFALWIYEHGNRQGAALKLISDKKSTLYFTDFGLDIPDLGVYNFNDRISSLYFTCSPAEFTLYFYEHPNYGGKSLCLKGPFHEYSIQNLKDWILQKPDFTHSSKDWNDEISSLRVSFYGISTSNIWS